MDNGIYITLTRQLALFKDMEVTANNLANANTTGFSAQRILFTSFLEKDINQGVKNPMALDHGISTYRSLMNGPIRKTGNPLDVAIEGRGYFVVETPLGMRYTRAGNFTVTSSGALITPEGYGVLDNANKPIVFAEDAQTIDIGSAGNIKVNGEDFATLGVVQFANEHSLEQAGGNLYRSDATAQPADASARVAQGALEGSNVQPVMELTRMMETSRSVGSTAQLVSAHYDLMRKTTEAWTKQR